MKVVMAAMAMLLLGCVSEVEEVEIETPPLERTQEEERAPSMGAAPTDLEDEPAWGGDTSGQRPPAGSYTADATLPLQLGERGIVWAWCRDGEARLGGSCEPATTTQGADQYGQRFGWACGWYALSRQRFTAHAVCAPK